MVTGICDSNKSRAQHHSSLKLGSRLRYLNTRNIRSFFQIKDNVKYYRCVIYEVNCSFGENYDGESVRNVVLRWAQYEDPNKQSEQTKHLKYFPDHQFE